MSTNRAAKTGPTSGKRDGRPGPEGTEMTRREMESSEFTFSLWISRISLSFSSFELFIVDIWLNKSSLTFKISASSFAFIWASVWALWHNWLFHVIKLILILVTSGVKNAKRGRNWPKCLHWKPKPDNKVDYKCSFSYYYIVRWFKIDPKFLESATWALDRSYICRGISTCHMLHALFSRDAMTAFVNFLRWAVVTFAHVCSRQTNGQIL